METIRDTAAAGFLCSPVALLVTTGVPAYGLASAILAAGVCAVATAAVAAVMRRRRTRLRSALPGAYDLLIAGRRNGLDLGQCLGLLNREAAGELGRAAGRMRARLRTGQGSRASIRCALAHYGLSEAATVADGMTAMLAAPSTGDATAIRTVLVRRGRDEHRMMRRRSRIRRWIVAIAALPLWSAAGAAWMMPAAVPTSLFLWGPAALLNAAGIGLSSRLVRGYAVRHGSSCRYANLAAAFALDTAAIRILPALTPPQPMHGQPTCLLAAELDLQAAKLRQDGATAQPTPVMVWHAWRTAFDSPPLPDDLERRLTGPTCGFFLPASLWILVASGFAAPV